jgi:hypothetical protein
MAQQRMGRRRPEVEISADCTVDQKDLAEIIGAVKLDLPPLGSSSLHRVRVQPLCQIISDRNEN